MALYDTLSFAIGGNMAFVFIEKCTFLYYATIIVSTLAEFGKGNCNAKEQLLSEVSRKFVGDGDLHTYASPVTAFHAR